MRRKPSARQHIAMAAAGGGELVDDVATAVLVVAVVTAAILWWQLRGSKSRRIQVKALFIYPVKSCAETKVESATVTARGFAGDLLFQCTDADGKYCTPRDDDKARLFKVEPRWAPEQLLLNAPSCPDHRVELGRAARTKTVSGIEVLCAPQKHALLDHGDEVATWLESSTGIPGVRLSGLPADFKRVVSLNTSQGDVVPLVGGELPPMSLADEAPFLLTSEESLADLNKRLRARGKLTVDMRRFRPNIVIHGLKPWEEDSIKRLKVGSVQFLVWQRCGRCKMTTIDRDTLKHGPEPLATLSTFRERAHGQRNFGMHMIPVEAGAQIAVGDEVTVLEFDVERRAEWQRLFG